MIGLYHKSPIPKKKSSKDWASVHASVCCTKELLGIWIYETKLLSFPSGKKNNQYSSPQHWINIFYSHLIKTTSWNYQGLDLSQANKLMVFHLGLHYSTVIPLLKIHTLSNRTKGGGDEHEELCDTKGGSPKGKQTKAKGQKARSPHKPGEPAAIQQVTVPHCKVFQSNTALNTNPKTLFYFLHGGGGNFLSQLHYWTILNIWRDSTCPLPFIQGQQTKQWSRKRKIMDSEVNGPFFKKPPYPLLWIHY